MSWDFDELEYGYDPRGRFQLRSDPKWVDPSHTRGKWDHPYSYDEFFLFGSREIIEKEGVGGLYSDRLWQWWEEGRAEAKKKDPKSKMLTYDELWKKHIGRRYDQASASQLSAFLTEYNQTLQPENYEGKSFTVVALAEGCNPSNGYPYWIIWYVEKKA